MARFSEIRKLMHGGSYTVDIPLDMLEGWLKSQSEDYVVDLDPDFQRGHVWSDEQRSRYVEFLLRGGNSQLTLYWNHPAYVNSSAPHCDLHNRLVLVDGKQRLTACLKFMRDEIPIFGHYLREFDDPVDRRCAIGMAGARLKMNVNNLQTRRELLQWYIDLNDGGVVHAPEEIARVRGLLEKEPPHAQLL
jgi:hypothetical protein